MALLLSKHCAGRCASIHPEIHWQLGSTQPLACVQIGIRLIPVLVNFWDDFGGVQFYVNSALGAGKAPENFYTHLGIRNYFKQWVRNRVACHLMALPQGATSQT
jgi:endo-1,4-beta-mannosidase